MIDVPYEVTAEAGYSDAGYSRSQALADHPATVGFGTWLVSLKRWNDFRGRSSRTEYWNFALFTAIVVLLIPAFAEVISGDDESPLSLFASLFALLYALVTFIPNIALSVRRLHDIGRSGWWWFIGLIPILNLLLVIWAIFPGEEGDNRYGPPPR